MKGLRQRENIADEISTLNNPEDLFQKWSGIQSLPPKKGALESAYTRLFAAGVLAEGEKGLAIKGPNWKAPQYMVEKRYV